MLLQRQIALRVRVLVIHVIDRCLIVDLDDDVISLRGDVLVEPRVRRNQLLVDILEIVELFFDSFNIY